MQINLIAVGQKMPSWVNEAYQEYAQRMPPECTLKLTEVPAEKRNKGSNTQKILKKEAERILSAISKNALIIAMDIKGQSWETSQVAIRLNEWMHDGRNIALLIGGPEGLDQSCKQTADVLWSLSPLTLPHPIVRVVLAEQLYRAWSIIKNHPYHRG